MSKSLPVLDVVDLDPTACCQPLATEPMSLAQAQQIAPLMKALADPVRLRLLSLVASHHDGEACVCDLADAFDLSQPTISHHLKVLHDAGLLDRDKRGVWVYYRVTGRRAGQPRHADRTRVMTQPRVLFVCVHNAGRSQMAAAWLQHVAGDRIDVRSAGSEPADQINPVVVRAMAEVGVDITDEKPTILADDVVRASDVVVTMGCGDACPVYPGKRYEDWDLEDPAGKDISVVRHVRDDIKRRIEALISETLAADPQLLTPAESNARKPYTPRAITPAPIHTHPRCSLTPCQTCEARLRRFQPVGCRDEQDQGAREGHGVMVAGRTLGLFN